jgi:hypothetical protein
MVRKWLRAALMAIRVTIPFAVAAPHAAADCTDLGGQGTLCTTGDPATGSFGAELTAGVLHICLIVNAGCP